MTIPATYMNYKLCIVFVFSYPAYYASSFTSGLGTLSRLARGAYFAVVYVHNAIQSSLLITIKCHTYTILDRHLAIVLGPPITI